MFNSRGIVRRPLSWGQWLMARRSAALLVVALLSISTTLLHAQATAQLSGTVTDTTGGVIPGAQVTVINETTKDTRTSQTNGTGFYAFPALAPSTYTIKVEVKNFQSRELTGIVLHAGDTLAVPTIALTVANAAAQTVVVEVAPDVLVQNNGERSEVLDAQQIENLALQGRDTTELLKVLPGATTTSGGLTQASPSFSDLNISANESAVGNGINLNGAPNRGGTALLSDGVNVLDPGDAAGSISIISPEMTQEVSVQTSNFGADAQYGPVVISSVSKSGGANYHGEAYFDARNDVLNANDWQDNNQGVARGTAHYYYPGGNFGGPVPKTNKKLFFWGGYERFLQNQGNANVLKSYIPTQEMLAGDFTSDNADNAQLCPNGFLPGAQNQAWCNDLDNTILPDGTKVTNGQIPSQFLDPGAKALASFWPKPNANPQTTPGGYNYYQPITNINNGWVYRLRVDYSLSDKTKFYISYQQAYSAELAQGNGAHIYWTPGNAVPFPGGGIFGKVYTKAISGHFVHTFNPTTTNEFIASWGYGNFPFTVPDISAAYKTTLNYPYATVYGGGSQLIPSYSSPGNYSFPDFSQNDIFENPLGNYLVRKEVPSFTDNLTKVWGSHTFKFGGFTQNVGNIQSNDGTYLNGDITSWSGQNANVFTGNLLGSPNNPVANFIMGNATGYQENNSAPISDMAYQTTSFYADDSWKVNSRVSVEYGARFEHVGHWYDRQGTGMAVFFPDRVLSDWNSGKIDPGFYWHAIDPGVPLSGQPNRFAFVSPRFGLSYDVFGTGNTVVRGGWGVYRFAGQYNDYAGALTTAQAVQTYNLPGQKSILLSQIGSLKPATCTTQCTSGSQTGLDANDYGVPVTYSYNFTIDQRLKWNTVFDIAYVGSSSSQILDNGETIEGSNFTALADQNKTPIGALFQPDPVTGVTSQNPENVAENPDGTITGNKVADYRPFGYAYGTSGVYKSQSISYTNYNGLQASWLKSSGRLTYDFNFTWSKTLGTGLQANPFVLRSNYGVEAIDRPYVFNASYTYQTGRFNHSNEWVRGAASGWTISGITTWQSGGSLLALLGNGVPNFGLSETYTNIPSTAAANGVTTSIGDPTYFGTDAAIAIQPALTCNPNSGLGTYQRVQLKCFAAPAVGTNGGQNYPYMSMGSYFDNDLALYKTFHVIHEQNVQFRISAFNWLNHPLPEFSSQNQLNLRYNVDYNSKAIALGSVSNTWGYMDTKSQAPYSRILELNVKYNF